MIDFTDFLNYLKHQDFYDEQIAHIETIPKREARFGELNLPIDKKLSNWLENQGINLWKHQADAINSILDKKNTAIITSTASGKTLCYNIPVMNSILKNQNNCAIYIFPRKALTRDQQSKLQDFLKNLNLNQSLAGVYDGSVEKSKKDQILRTSNIILTNSYALHQYLPSFKRRWNRIIKNLKYIVIDEVHTYRGIFGSNFALMIRRLKRILNTLNIKPIWILASATMGTEAKEFMEKLIGEEVNVIDNDTSPTGEKKVLLWDLPYNEILNSYRSAHQETKNIYLAHLKKGIQTLTFTTSRKMSELQAIWAKNALKLEMPLLENKVRSYRAGIRKETRREIEKGLRENTILGVSSTNALELGMDIGTLDATIISGFPGTISSFRQQIGRAGRGEDISFATYVAMPNPLDLFYVHHPETLFGTPNEKLLITLTNKYLLRNQLSCAANEIPISENENLSFGIEDKQYFIEILGDLVNKRLLNKRGPMYFWTGGFFPNGRYSLDDLSENNYKIILKSKDKKEEILTSEDESYIFRDLHTGAVYLFEAESYLVEEIDLEQKKVYIRKSDLNFYTESLKHTEISQIKVNDEIIDKRIHIYYGDVKVKHDYYAYREVETISQEILNYYDLDLPTIEFETKAFWFLIPEHLEIELDSLNYNLGGSIHALEHAIIAISPLFALIDRWDLGGVSIDVDTYHNQPVIYVYDGYKGGIGITESLYPIIRKLLESAYDLVKNCKCTSYTGCPGCIMSPKCGNNNTPLDKDGALYILNYLIEKKALN